MSIDDGHEFGLAVGMDNEIHLFLDHLNLLRASSPTFQHGAQHRRSE
jgi:hypothetical protein